MDLRPPPKGDSSRQVGYHIILVAEGNTVGDEILWLGDVDHLVDSGRGIGITHRAYVRSGGSPVIIIT